MAIKRNTIHLLAGIACLLLASCNKFLDVKPEDKLLEEQVFSSETGINNALNGIYLSLSDDGLYGGSLTLSTVDVMAQRYNLGAGTHTFGELGKYNYNNDAVKNSFNTTWLNAYKAILNTNLFLQKLKGSADIISADRRELLTGEAYGLRALLHFDMLRLFGPMYGSSPSSTSIPYYKNATAKANELLPASEVIKQVLTDLDSAALLLKNDPIINAGLQQSDTTDGSNFYRYRNLHFNYYAVQALKARVLLYAGRKTEAGAVAEQVINATVNRFPWTLPANVNAQQNPDRVFSTEVIFGIQNTDLYTQQNNYFSSTLASNRILAPLDKRLNDVFEGNQNDYRFNSSWKLPVTGGKDYRTFFRFEDVSGTVDFNPVRYLQPLLRISEMYYIVAETDTDPQRGLGFLNKVRFRRGLPDLAAGANLVTAISMEYQREFFGEGQLFFFYKRRAEAAIPNGSATAGNLSMTADQYVVPLPYSETQFRN